MRRLHVYISFQIATLIVVGGGRHAVTLIIHHVYGGGSRHRCLLTIIIGKQSEPIKVPLSLLFAYNIEEEK